MKFSSLQEYFYKLQTILFLLILAPLVAFMIAIGGLLTNPPYQETEGQKMLYVGIAVCFLALVMNVVATFLFRRTMKGVSKMVGLSLKLDHYCSATVMRYSIGAVSNLVLVVGFFFTGHFIFACMFGATIVLFFITWPWSSKVCADLKLKGDEKEMVLYKKIIYKSSR